MAMLPQFLHALVSGRDCTIVHDNATRPAHSLTEQIARFRAKHNSRSNSLRAVSSSRWEVKLRCTAPKSPGRRRRQRQSLSPERSVTLEDDDFSYSMNFSAPITPTAALSNDSSPLAVSHLQPRDSSTMNQSNASLDSHHSSFCRWSSKSASTISWNELPSRAQHRLVSCDKKCSANMSRHLSLENLLPEARGQPPKKPVRRQSFGEEKTAELLGQALRISFDTYDDN